MSIFWQECKHILRSWFWLGVTVLGVILCIYNGFMNSYTYGSEGFALSYEFTQ